MNRILVIITGVSLLVFGGGEIETAAIQERIDCAAAVGGGVVRIARGRHVTGSLFLKNNVTLEFEVGAVLEGSRDPKDYNPQDVCPQNGICRAENVNGQHLLLAIGVTNVTLRGAGAIDGNGLYFFTNGFDRARIGRTGVNGLGIFNAQDAIKWRPAQMLYFVECQGIRLEGLKILNAPYWSVFVHGCQDVSVSNVTVRTSRSPHVMNADGLNFDCCRHVRVTDCDVSTADDALCLRANGKRLLHAPPETSDVVVRNCRLSSGAESIRIGVGAGVIRDCVFEDLDMPNTHKGIVLSCTWFPSPGVNFENISFSNVTANCWKSFLCIHRLGCRDAFVRNISFSDFHVKAGAPSYIWARRERPFENILLRQFFMDQPLEEINGGVRVEGGNLRLASKLSEDYLEHCNMVENGKESDFL